MTITLDDAKLEVAKLEAESLRVQLQKDRLELEHIRASEESHLIYPFYADVHTDSISHCIRTLGNWHRRQPEADITILFTSPGGQVFDGIALFDFLRELGRSHRVVTKVLGVAASMGGVLLQAGTERVASSRSWMLIHEVSGGAYGTTSRVADMHKLYERLEGQLRDILAERSIHTSEEIAALWKNKDVWLNAEEMLEQGFVDRIE